MKIIGISDTHSFFPKSLPKADILIHAGDFSFLSKHFKNDLNVLSREFKNLLNYFASISQRYDKVILVPGNHDFIFESFLKEAKEMAEENSKIKVLVNEEIIINDIKIYGSPVSPSFCNWAFNVDRGAAIQKYWDLIPRDTDVLVTHGPPLGILDEVFPNDCRPLGCYNLAEEVKKLYKLKAHFFGHIHGSRGSKIIDSVNYVNCAYVDERYVPYKKKYEVIKI